MPFISFSCHLFKVLLNSVALLSFLSLYFLFDCCTSDVEGNFLVYSSCMVSWYKQKHSANVQSSVQWLKFCSEHILSRIYNCAKPANRPIDNAPTAHFTLHNSILQSSAQIVVNCMLKYALLLVKLPNLCWN